MINDIKEQYIQIPESILKEKISPGAKIFYGYVKRMCKKRGYCWATNDRFAELLGVTTRTITNYIIELENCGHIDSICIYKSEKGRGRVEVRKIYMKEKNFHQEVEKNFNEKIEKNFQDNNINNNNNILEKNFHQKKDYPEDYQAFKKIKELYPNKEINEEECFQWYMTIIMGLNFKGKNIQLSHIEFEIYFTECLKDNEGIENKLTLIEFFRNIFWHRVIKDKYNISFESEE